MDDRAESINQQQCRHGDQRNRLHETSLSKQRGKHSEENRVEEKGGKAEKSSQDQLRGSPVNIGIQPGIHLRRSLFDQVIDEDSEQSEQQFPK